MPSTQTSSPSRSSLICQRLIKIGFVIVRELRYGSLVMHSVIMKLSRSFSIIIHDFSSLRAGLRPFHYRPVEIAPAFNVFIANYRIFSNDVVRPRTVVSGAETFVFAIFSSRPSLPIQFFQVWLTESQTFSDHS